MAHLIIYTLSNCVCFLFNAVCRFEEREAELKKEYNTLHQRHTEVCWSGIKTFGQVHLCTTYMFIFTFATTYYPIITNNVYAVFFLDFA